MKYFKTSQIFIVLSIIALLLIGLVLYSRTYKKEALNQEIPHQQALIHEVSLINDQAEPNELVMKVGEEVQFNTKDNQQHVISEGKGNDYGEKHNHIEVGTTSDSQVFAAGEAYRIKISKPGTYYFHDDLHPNIYISILVY